MRSKFLPLFLCMILLAALPAHAAFTTSAPQAILVDQSTGTILFEKNADQKMTPSSMSKLMTLYVVFERLKKGAFTLEDTFVVSERAWRTGGSKMFVELGKRIRIEDLLQGVAVQSGNDACVVLAEGISGSHESFADEMNRVAARIGLKNSHFKNADGLPDPQHMMTARDLAVLAVRIIEDFPEHYPRFSQSDFTYHGIRQANRNPLLGDKELGVDGMKTGHTEDGGYGIVISAKQAERRLVLVVNGLTSTKERATEAERLLRYGFREFEVKTPFKQGDKLADVPVWMGGSLSVPAVVGHDVAVTLPRHRQGEVKLSLEHHAPLAAPVAKGQEIGRLLIQFPNADPQIVPVQAGEDVPALSGLGRIWPALKYYIFIRG